MDRYIKHEHERLPSSLALLRTEYIYVGSAGLDASALRLDCN